MSLVIKWSDRSRVALLILVISIAAACERSPEQRAKIETQTFTVKAVVVSVDPDAGKITVDHEEIPGYMSAMVMSIAVRDPAILSDVRSGDRIEFELLREGSELLITRINVTENRSKGEAIFKANCATCHGDRGQGTKKGIPLTSGHALAHSEDEHIGQVRDGKRDKMPPFRDKLTEDEIRAVVKYVRDTLQSGVTDSDRKAHHH